MKALMLKCLFHVTRLGVAVIAITLIAGWTFPVLTDHNTPPKKEKKTPILSSMGFPTPSTVKSPEKKKKPEPRDAWVPEESIDDIIN